MQLDGAWQAVHAVDTVQTYHAMSDPCYVEADPITRRIIGSRPNDAHVIAWGVGYAGFHYGVSRLLDAYAPRWISQAWGWATLADNTMTDFHNASIGIRIGAPNVDPKSCYPPKPVEFRAVGREQ